MEEIVNIPVGWNELKAGITREDLRRAIAKSGYPLQASVAEVIRNTISSAGLDHAMFLQEEWAYIDGDSGETRSIDIFADISLSTEEQQLGITLDLLVECKQSELPYVFFIRGKAPGLTGLFPEIVGLKSNYIEVYIKKDERTAYGPVSMSIHDGLRFWSEQFFDAPVPYAISLAKSVRKGKELELTGEEAYRSLTLPLLKAATYLRRSWAPVPESPSKGCVLVFSIAVLRAPMYCLYRKGEKDVLDSLPWVRVCRLEPGKLGIGATSSESEVRFYDVVHENYLEAYLDHLLKSSLVVSAKLQEAAQIIIDGRAVHGPGDLFAEMVRPIPESVHLPESDKKVPVTRFWRGMTSLRLEPASVTTISTLWKTGET